MASGFISLFAKRMNQQAIGKVLREIGLLPQLYEQFLATDDRTVVSLLCKNYCYAISQPLLTYVSDFYDEFLCSSPSEHNCSLCSNQHSQNQLCLPHLFEKEALDLLFDTLECKRFYLGAGDSLVSLIKICGYLLIKTDVLHVFLLNFHSTKFAHWKAQLPLSTSFIGTDIWRALLITRKLLTIQTFMTY